MRNATGRFSQDLSVYDVIGSFCTRFGTISAANVTTWTIHRNGYCTRTPLRLVFVSGGHPCLYVTRTKTNSWSLTFLFKFRITLLSSTRHIRQTFLRSGFHAQDSNERRQAMLNPSGANVKINASHPTQIQESDPNDRLCIYCSRVSCIQRQ